MWICFRVYTTRSFNLNEQDYIVGWEVDIWLSNPRVQGREPGQCNTQASFAGFLLSEWLKRVETANI